MILTIDLGTSVTKVVVWGAHGPIASGRSALESHYGAGNRAEQDPASWWPSVVAAADQARAELDTRHGTRHGTRLDSGSSDGWEAIEAVGFAAARQSFVPVAADGTPLGPALLWSDRRAAAEARAVADSFGPDGAATVRRCTGVVLDAGSVAAKVAWLERHEPDRLEASRWLLAPRDVIAWRLTGEVSTDVTLASATGLFGMGTDVLGPVVPGLLDAVGSLADRLPEPRRSDSIVGGVRRQPAAELGLRADIPVVIGAGDRACEVLGAGASERWPMVSWGTTANVSVPVVDLVGTGPPAMIVTRGALEGWLLEGGLSAAGSAVDWLARLAGTDVDTVMDRARSSPPGARGVRALAWFGGARAPWWRDTARAGLLGLSLDHDIGDMARAVVESVAWDVARCLDAAASDRADGAEPIGVVLGGGGATDALWVDVLTAVTGRPARRRRSGDAAAAGAAMIVARTIGAEVGEIGEIGEIEAGAAPGGGDEVETSPDPSLTAAYAALRPTADAAAAAVIDFVSP